MKMLILGAGPAGLSFANALLQKGETDFLVLEAENEAGGLCRSCDVDGSPFDAGGGHFLDVRRPKVTEFLFQFMPQDEWDVYERDSQIEIEDGVVHHPLEANIWELPLPQQVKYLKSIAQAGCNIGKPKPERFVEWIRWKLGDVIADAYMLPYNQKMFSDDLNELGTYWLDKLPDVSFEETLLSCLEHKAHGRQPGHAQFYYPKKYGYGELWLRMAEKLSGHIEYGKKVQKMNLNSRTVTTQDGQTYTADVIITTIPWKSVSVYEDVPQEILNDISALRHSGIETRYFDNKLDTTAHWIYYADEKIPYHRILVRHNFCPGSKGYWTETRLERVSLLGEAKDQFCYQNKYAYPMNTLHKPEQMSRILQYARERQVYGLGRWGEHQHYNSDLTVEKALELAAAFVKG